MKRYEFPLYGLDCAKCAQEIEEYLQKQDDYSFVRVSFATAKVIIETTLEEEMVTQQIEKDIQKVEPNVFIFTTEKKKIDMMLLRIIITTVLLIISFVFFKNIFLFLFIYLIIGYDILFTSLKNLVKGKFFDEFFLMSLATVCAFIIGEYTEAVAVMLFFQIGEYVQEKAIRKSRQSITELLDLKSDYANLIVDHITKKVDPSMVKVGDEILVKPGEKIPLDGVVIDGKSTLDTSMLTGESMPHSVTVEDIVYGGTINLSGLLKVKVTKIATETLASSILDMMEHAASKKTNTERFITKFSKVYTPVIVICALLLCLIPVLFFQGNIDTWASRSLVFLVISCPCALVISIPLGFFSGIGTASKQGILLKGSDALELLPKIDTAVFDKTGTITKGKFAITSVVTDKNKNTNLIIEYAAIAEQFSNHPIAKTILERYGKSCNSEEVKNYQEVAGKGVKVEYRNEVITVGNYAFMEQEQIEVPTTNAFGTIVYVARNKEYMGYLIIEDQVKDEIDRTLYGLRKQGIHHFVVVSGDSKPIVSRVCHGIGIQKYYAETLPTEKANIVKELKQKHKVFFVGDGMNDALVLTEADLGISMGGIGSDAATMASDIVIMNDDLSKIVTAIEIAKKTKRVVWTNIIFAISVKLLVLLLGAFGYAPIWLAIFADVGVTLITIFHTIWITRRG